MSRDLIHFPNFKRTYFGNEFQNETLSVLTRVRDDIGCRHIIHGYQKRMGNASKYNSDNLALVITVPTTWSMRYSAKNYFAIDPIFQENSPYFQEDASGIVRELHDDAVDSPAVDEMLRDAEKHGIGSAFIAVSARNPKGILGCTLFVFDLPPENRAEFVVKMRARLLSVAGIIHNTICGSEGNSPASNLLTPREVDCLRWAANGKTDGEIAEILSIARWTVVTYLQNAKIKLNSSNRTSAVATALALGIIELPVVHNLSA